MKKLLVCCIVLSALILCSCGNNTIASRARKKGLDIGTAFASDIYDPEGQKRIKDFANVLVAENICKWTYVHPNARFWNWNEIDDAVNFAEKNKINMKWHTLFWHQQIPPFLSSLKTKEDAEKMIEDYISSIMQRYKGRIKYYDVVNEMFEEDGSFRHSLWYNLMGDDFIPYALKVARAQDPSAKLYLNEYNNENMGYAKSEAMYNYVKKLVDDGVPIDGIGMQLHLASDEPFNKESIRENVRRYGKLGIEVSFSEVDVRIPDTKFNDEQELKRQSDIYTGLLDIALTEPNVKSYLVWGMYDKTNWVPTLYPSYGNACVFDIKNNKKQVYFDIYNKLK